MNINAPFTLYNQQLNVLLALGTPFDIADIKHVIRLERYSSKPSDSEIAINYTKEGPTIYLYLETRYRDGRIYFPTDIELEKMKDDILELIRLSTEGWRGLSTCVDVSALPRDGTVLLLHHRVKL